MKCVIILLVANLIGLSLAAQTTTNEQEVEKCFKEIKGILDTVVIPQTVLSFVKKISAEQQVLTLDNLDNEVLAKYTVPDECGDFSTRVDAILNQDICSEMNEDQALKVRQKLMESHQAYLEAALACYFGSD